TAVTRAGGRVRWRAPVPAFATVRPLGCRPKVAVTVVLPVRVTVQVPVPLHPPPLQPVKVEPVSGVAVSVTAVPLAYVPEHVAPQMIPDGGLMTAPLPLPIFSTARLRACALMPQATLE